MQGPIVSDLFFFFVVVDKIPTKCAFNKLLTLFNYEKYYKEIINQACEDRDYQPLPHYHSAWQWSEFEHGRLRCNSVIEIFTPPIGRIKVEIINPIFV